MATADPDNAAVADAVRRGARPEAINLAARALKRGSRHPLVLVLAAEGLEATGKPEEAVGLLRMATEAAPKQKVAWMRLAALQARRQRFGEAARAFDAVLAVEPRHYAALMGAAEMRLFMNEMADAERLYQRAAEAAPDLGEPLAILAVTAAQRGDAGAARALAERAARLAPGILGAELALARADLLEGAPALAEARASRVLERTDLSEENRADTLDIRAAARDAQDLRDEGFADYAELNAILRRMHAATFNADPEQRPPRLARRQTAFLSATPSSTWATPAGPDKIGAATVRGHVFLAGFPRSGTTLLEKVLAGHPACATLEEVNILAHAGKDLRDGDAAWSRLAALSPDEGDARRRVYWKGVGDNLGDLTGKVVIDKLPLHTLDLPLISKLFPAARILFALRDPRDVVLSCFRRRFRVNVAMYEFLSLADTADFYDATMALASVARTVLPLNLLEVRHESVIDDFDGVISGVLDFIGLDWDPEVRRFADRVGGRMKTPSHAQLRRGLNSDGVGQWRRYEAHMIPVLPVLEPWATRYGYLPAAAAEKSPAADSFRMAMPPDTL